MIKLFFIPVAVMLSCGSTKSYPVQLSVDSAMVAEKTIQDSSLVANAPGPVLPTCIKSKIDSFKLKEVHERPQRVLEYIYKGKKVYLVVMPCCDFFNEVYDDKCNYLGAPDGGFTGKGDGKIPDFYEAAKSEKLVWGTAKTQ